MRCTSRNMSVALRRDLSTGRPMEIFGTNSPSITSTCSQSAPAAFTSAASSPNLQKSDAKIEGAILIILVILPCRIIN